MMFLLGVLVGVLVMYLITGFLIYSYGKGVDSFLRADRKTSALAILTWPSEAKRLIDAGLSSGADMAPVRANLAKGHDDPKAPPPGWPR